MIDDALAIDLQGVSKVYRRRVRALNDVSLQVRRGEIFGLLGPNGAGKSTLVKIMMTVVRPTAAAGSILGQPVGHKPTLARVGYLPENHRFPRYLTGRQAIEFFAGLCGVHAGQRKRRAGELLETVGMSEWGDTKVSQYSKGMMQRIGLATALAADPQLIVLDEPTDGVDPVGRRDVRDVLLKLRDEGKTVFVNSHLLSELEMVCDRVAVLVKGQVAVQGTLAELTSRRQFYLFEMVNDADLAAKIAAALPGVFASAPNGPILRGKLAGGQWCELEATILRVGMDDPLEAQQVLDALRRGGLALKRMHVLRPSLEDLFIEVVSDRAGASPGGTPLKGGPVIATLALILDSYREINAKRLFWIVLVISGVFVAAFAGVGLTPTGITIFGWRSPLDFGSNLYTPAAFYKLIYVNLGIRLWLSWAAMILAIASTAGVFPDFLASGSVDLYLARPISRPRLFLVKYGCGLLFVVLQVAVFSLASFVVIGLRGGVWEPGLLMAIPLVALMFSYLFGVCTLIGVLTRSTLAALLLTLIFWLAMSGLQAVDRGLLEARISSDRWAATLDREIAQTQDELNAPAPATQPADDPPPATQPLATRPIGNNSWIAGVGRTMGWLLGSQPPHGTRHGELEERLTSLRRQRDDITDYTHMYRTVHMIETPLPKTAETVALLERELSSAANLPRELGEEPDVAGAPGLRQRQRDRRIAGAYVERELRQRSVWWIIGTSLGFEVVTVGLAAWIFCRRDY